MMTFALIVLAAATQPQDRPGTWGSEDKQRVLDRMNTMRITVDLQDASFDQAIDYFREGAGLNISVDPEIYTRLTPEQQRVTLKVKDLVVKSALKLMLFAKDLTMSWKDGVLLVLPKDKAAGALSTRMYDVRDLLFKIKDFPGPSVDLQPPSAAPGPGPVINFEPEPPQVLTEGFVLELVKSCTGDRSWEQVTGATINVANGMLIVTQSARVQREVADLLDRLRQFK